DQIIGLLSTQWKGTIIVVNNHVFISCRPFRALRCGWTLTRPVGAGDSVKNPNAPIGANIKNNNSTDILHNLETATQFLYVNDS
ncbi:MAG: hypothetical protein LBE12_00430, partial [Planctomycetaceae bacterium]|nr:hypothetical protein [Planctomycetaceae bacterium]